MLFLLFIFVVGWREGVDQVRFYQRSEGQGTLWEGMSILISLYMSSFAIVTLCFGSFLVGQYSDFVVVVAIVVVVVVVVVCNSFLSAYVHI